jgi:tight adherence protein C
MDDTTLVAICIFGAVTLITLWLANLFGGEGRRVRHRLSNNSVELPVTRGLSPKAQIKNIFSKVGQAASKPFMPENRQKHGELRRRLAMAGIYTPSAIRAVKGFNIILLFVGMIGGAFAGSVLGSTLLGLSLGGIVGYLVPAFWISMQIKTQQRSLEYGLPDALDLMVVCVEAGLAVDSAMDRVSHELEIVHPRLTRELEITHMETRVGVSRAEALKNLGQRTGSRALQSLASMLVQADRFGTSIAGALRIHAESLRITRQQKAEELAAKASVKMSFPLVLFIFPATFIVLAGPTVVELLNSSLFN